VALGLLPCGPARPQQHKKQCGTKNTRAVAKRHVLESTEIFRQTFDHGIHDRKT
jgi:hypothetical protein